jgi:site-specific DNA-cytosine methylase
MGWHLAGYDVTGIDLDPQPRYPFTFIQGDAIEYIREHGREYDVITGGPPCQRYAVGNFSNVPYVKRDMGVEWMSRDGIRECIPPAYTRFLGEQVAALLGVGVTV